MDRGSPEEFLREHGTSERFVPPLDDGWERQEEGAYTKSTASAEEPQPRGEKAAKASKPIECITLAPVGIRNIPPRPWAYGRFLLSGSAAVVGAVDGGGKGAISVVMMLAVIIGRPLLGERVWRQGPVAIITYEDDQTEWHRRIAAACIHYELDYETVLRGVHFIVRPEGRVTFAASVAGFVTFPDGEAIITKLKAIGAVMLTIDPFNHSHDFDDGNNNVLVAKVAAELSRVAEAAGVAVMVLHHLRKGSTGNPDDLMGATSLRATFRSCRILTRMAPEVAKKMKIKDPWRYIRIAGSKENYAPPPEKSSWFKLVGVPLGNATDDYPEGDDIGVATTWQSRPMFDGMESDTLLAVFDELRRTPHGPTKQAKNTPWAALPLTKIGGRSEREAASIIKAWLENGVLIKGEYYHAESKHTLSMVKVASDKAAEILASLSIDDAPRE